MTLLCCFVAAALLPCWAQDGTLDPTFDPGTGPTYPNPNSHQSTVRSIALPPDGKVVIAGEFSLVDGTVRHGLARLNTDGSLDASFNPAIDQNVYTNAPGLLAAVQLDGKVIYYADVNTGYGDRFISRFNADGSLDTGFHLGTSLNGGVAALLVLPDGKILVGEISGVFRLNTDGSIDQTFNVGTDSNVYSLAVQPDGKVLIGGLFKSVNGVSRHGLARLNADGSLDTSFVTNGVGTSSSVRTIVVQPDGKILASEVDYTNVYNGVEYLGPARFNPDGSFDFSFVPYSRSDLILTNNIALQPDGKIVVSTIYKTIRLNADGSLDNTFSTAVTTDDFPSYNTYANTMARSSDGRIYVGGSFVTVGGVARENIARLKVTAPAGNAPQISGTTAATATIGTVFNYQITGTNTPLSYAVSGLPAGLKINPATGVISGVPTVAGTFSFVIAATNAAGTGTATLTLTINHPAFFAGEVPLSNGVYYLAFSNGNPFGYYSYLSNPNYLYHFDLGYEYVFNANDSQGGVYLYDFKSSTFFYSSPTFPFPYLYDFSLNTVLYYYPDLNNAGHYNTNGVRYFYNFATGKVISK